ncbi:MAG: hypothetical protein MJZ25_08710 [Fibrobacter sp.]|nr:hypothetical protein [Fibrobacter sp.]
MEYTSEFHQFLDKLAAETGHHNLIEAIREGYKVTHPLCEGKVTDWAKKSIASAALAGSLATSSVAAPIDDDQSQLDNSDNSAFVCEQDFEKIDDLNDELSYWNKKYEKAQHDLVYWLEMAKLAHEYTYKGCGDYCHSEFKAAQKKFYEAKDRRDACALEIERLERKKARVKQRSKCPYIYIKN